MVLPGLGASQDWARSPDAQPVEARTLALDAGLAGRILGWRTHLTALDALRWSVEWYRAFDAGEDADRMTIAQIKRYEALL